MFRTAETYRTALRVEASTTTAEIKNFNETRKQWSPIATNAPYYNPDAVAILDAIARMDPKTGHIPGDVPSELRATQ